MKTITRLLGRTALVLVTMAFLTMASVFILGGYLITWPILRQSPTNIRKRALTQLAVDIFALAHSFTPDEEDDSAADQG